MLIPVLEFEVVELARQVEVLEFYDVVQDCNMLTNSLYSPLCQLIPFATRVAYL